MAQDQPADESPAEKNTALDADAIDAIQRVLGSGRESASPSEGNPLSAIPRVVSVILLLGVVLFAGVMFFRVMASFLAPLFLAAVLAVVFGPLHDRIKIWSWLRGRKELAALATTTVITVGVLGPTSLLGWMAFVETEHIVKVALADRDTGRRFEKPAASQTTPPRPDAETVDPDAAADQNAAADNDAPADTGWAGYLFGRISSITDWYQSPANEELAKLAEYAARNAVQLGLVGVQALVNSCVGLCIMVFALYYFFADGPMIIDSLMHLSPLDDDYERELLVRFASVSRAVVLATIVSAIVQGLLGGVGYFFALDSWAPPSVVAAYGDATSVPESEKIEPPLFLLTVATILLAIIPFLGATAVWLPVAAWLFWVQGSPGWAIFMLLYGTFVVSTIDNFIKPYVLHGQSNLHPLLALLSVLGGIQLLGPVGILVGPMLVAFLQALLEMLRKELDGLKGEPEASPQTA